MKQVRDKEILVRVSAAEKERILTKMGDAGISNMSAYIRKMALDGICVRLDLQEVRELLVLLRRCSNNLNQYTKRLTIKSQVQKQGKSQIGRRP